MNVIKELRKQLGYTQSELAQETGLALRTIQRAESGNGPPKGHTLKMLSEVFGMTNSALLEKFGYNKEEERLDEINCIRKINLSILTFLGIPFGNIIFPLFLWQSYRESELVDDIGRKIINTQIIWWVLLSFSLSVSPFISRFVFNGIPIILHVLFIAYVLNVVMVYFIADRLKNHQLNFLDIRLRLI